MHLRPPARFVAWVLPVCLFALTVSAAVVAAQANAGRPDSTARPFHFQPRMRARAEPSSDASRHLKGWPYPFGRGRTTSDVLRSLARWLDAVRQHQPGEADAGVRAVGPWSHDQFADVVLAFESDRVRLRPEAWTLAERAVLLHTDVAILGFEPAVADIAWTSDTSSLHFGVAFELVEWLRKETTEEGAFVHRWYQTTAAFLVSRHEIESAPILLEMAVSRFRADAHLLLLAGAVQELLASPRVQEGGDLRRVNKWGPAGDHLIAAEHFYRRALEAEPSLTEARVRLGHVIGQRGRHAQALEELKRALGENVPLALLYFAHLFVGEEEEALNRPGAARAAYGRALALRSDVQFAYLALSRLERRSGNRAAAVETLQHMLQLPREAEWQTDPWEEYYEAGPAQRVAELLEQFRKPFRSRR